MLRTKLRPILAVLMVAIGTTHFTSPDFFVAIVPDWLPAPLALVYISGVFEVALGLMLLAERTRVLAAWGLVALYIAVYPANIHMALHPDLPLALPSWMPRPSPLAAWLRLPFQFVLIYWAWLYTRPAPELSPGNGAARPT